MQKKRKLPIYAVLSIAFLTFCSTGFLLAPNDPKALTLEAKLLSPCMSYPFGTDELGRCIFSRILMGGYVTLGMALCSAAIVAVAGTAAGLLLGHAGSGKRVVVDSAINAATAIPPIAYLVIFNGIWGNSIPTMMVALTASLILRMIKLVKTLTEIEMGKAYIMCMVSSGATKNGILFAHVLPNIAGEIVHFLCLSCAEMIVGISAFSFIGFTLGDEVIDWGSMLASARKLMGVKPSLLFYPSLFIFLSTVSFNMLGRLFQKENTDHA